MDQRLDAGHPSEVPMKVLRLPKAEGAMLYIWVTVESDEFRTTRMLAITDPNVDVADLLRKIAAGRTWLTRCDEPEGELWDPDDSEERIVGRWETRDKHYTAAEPPRVSFDLGHDLVIGGGELHQVTIEVGDARPDGAQPPAHPRS